MSVTIVDCIAADAAADYTSNDLQVQESGSQRGDSAKKNSVDGWRTGTFIFKPAVTVTQLYDDNIFATRNNEIDDSITILSPSIAFDSVWQKHYLGLSANADLARYASNSTENYQDFTLSTDGRYDVSPSANIFGGFTHADKHEERSSQDDINGIEPTRYREDSAHLGIFRKFNRYRIRLGSTIDQLDFQNVENLAGFTNDDRDRTELSYGARISYQLDQKYEPYFQAIRTRRLYDQAVDDNLYNRDSSGYQLGMGLNIRVDNKNKAEVYLGYIHNHYHDTGLSDVDNVDIGLGLTSKITPQTTIDLSLDRSLEETTVNGASSYLYTVASASLGHSLNTRTSVDFNLLYSINDYQGLARTDKEFLVELGFKHFITSQIYTSAYYRWLGRQSDIPIADYYRNQIYVAIGGLLYPVASPRNSLMTASQPGFNNRNSHLSGFYAGLLYGHGTLGTESLGPRGGGGFDYGEFGRDGNAPGLFAGYGFYMNRWYLGLELDAEHGQVGWYHVKDKPESRTFNVQKLDSSGISARFGYGLTGNRKLYARYGLVKTDFDTYYTLNDAPADAYDQSITRKGKRYGIGVDIPESKHVFWRMEYSYTDYDDYQVDYVSNAETFDNNEGLFRVGLGWYSGNQKPPDLRSRPLRNSGPYVGAGLAHGSLNTAMTGLHRSAGEGPFNFAADFSQLGPGGALFAGYGVERNRIYLALEFESEASHTGWRHDRLTGGPGGRDFSVEKKGGYGAGIRIGYRLPSQSLIYVRADRTRTKFNTRYVKGNNASAWVDRDDRRNGERYGVGAETALSGNVFLRFDYSLTRFDDYDFTTTHGVNPDYNRFSNHENRFMLGLGVRF